MELNRDFGSLGQELGRFADSIDEGSSRKRWNLIRGHSLIVIALDIGGPTEYWRKDHLQCHPTLQVDKDYFSQISGNEVGQMRICWYKSLLFVELLGGKLHSMELYSIDRTNIPFLQAASDIFGEKSPSSS